MSKTTFLIVMALLGLLYAGSAGVGLFQNDSADPQPDDVNQIFEQKFGWLKAQSATADELGCEPAAVLQRKPLSLHFTKSIQKCVLSIHPAGSGASRSLKLTCPEGATLKITLRRASGDKPETKDLPTEFKGQKYDNASWELAAGDTLTLEVSAPAECRVSIGG